jgi:hypothetical protein
MKNASHYPSHVWRSFVSMSFLHNSLFISVLVDSTTAPFKQPYYTISLHISLIELIDDILKVISLTERLLCISTYLASPTDTSWDARCDFCETELPQFPVSLHQDRFFFFVLRHNMLGSSGFLFYVESCRV